MSSVYEVRWRLLFERLEEMLARAEQAHGDEDCIRLAALGLALLERHKVDGKGRCRWCRSRRGWWERRARRCVVLPLVNWYLIQPREMVIAYR